MKVLLFEVNPYLPPALPISLGYLSSRIRALGHEARIVNLGEGSSFSVGGLGELIEDFAPALVGFAAYQRNMLHVLALSRAIKEADPSIRVILGGPQATFMPAEAMAQMPHVDYVCRGEGEVVIAEVIAALQGGRGDEPIRGTLTRLSPREWVEGGPVEPPSDLDSFPSPYLSECMDLEGREEVILLTSRGCPYGCIFCYTPRAFRRKVRYHSPERVLDEMTFLNRRGIQRFWVADPSFTVNRSHAEEVLHGMIRRGIKGTLWLETRADLVDRELLRLMHAAGVRQVAFGLESASERVLDKLGKGVSPCRIKEAVSMAMEEGLEVELFSQYGLPGERFEDALQTLRFVQGLVPVKGNSNAQQMRLYFGSDVQQDPNRWGIIPLEEERPAYLSVGDRYETCWMSMQEIHRIGDMWKEASLDGARRLVS